MNTYTPGPWRVTKLSDGRYCIGSKGNSRNVAKGVYREADARLIVNAPEMASLLRDLVGSSFPSAASISPDSVLAPIVRDYLDRARKILNWVDGARHHRRPDRMLWQPDPEHEGHVDAWECPVCGELLSPCEGDDSSPYEWGWKFCPQCGLELSGPNAEEREAMLKWEDDEDEDQ